ncbi:uncharacterized protein LOC134615274 [Pelobates fuscus]|uniref:uncharacterized protein LOC134615274 n=1 Tax=Pelobates fuscus TaxID=191477 RepID=UPI002FE4F8A9
MNSVPSLLLQILFVTGSVGAVSITVHQLHVGGYENSSVILSTSYDLSKPLTWLQIRWELVSLSPPLQLVICTIRSSEEGSIIKQFPENGYEDRMFITPENGSLTINHMQNNDSGLYRVTIRDKQVSEIATINVTVFEKNQEFVDIEIEDNLEVTADENKTSHKPRTLAHCICSDNSTSVDLHTTAWIFFGSRISSALLSLIMLGSLHLYLSQPRRYRRRKILAPDRCY